MSATTLNAPIASTPAERPVVVQPVTQARVIRSEWIKFSTLRSTWITLLLSMMGTIGIGALASWGTNQRWSHLHADDIASFSAVSRSLFGVNLAQLAVGVLGVLIITGEYATGMIRATLTAVPKRLPVLWGKLGVLSTVMFVSSLISTVIAFFLGQALLSTHGVGIGAPHAVRAIVGAALYLTIVAILAMGIGFAVRSTAGGIATVFGLLLVLPGLGNALPASWQPHLLPYLPSNAGSPLFQLHPDPGSLGPWTGLFVMCLWAAAAVLAGALRLRGRDA
ncbi:MAG: ABC transporter permease [Actinomycetota bacterium]|nr:ABC transporter permease [Actinomycetota bacterium]MDQ2955930.1 ABC transporter permease [Actinomycetota bacterium]